MIDAILTFGDSSWLRQDLVKGKKSVIQYEANLGWPFASAQDFRDPEPYAMMLIHNPTFQSDQIVDQVQEELAKLQKRAAPAKDLDRIKTQLDANRIQGLQSSLSRARALAQYEIADGKPELINTEMEAMLAVTPEQIQAAAKKYFTPGQARGSGNPAGAAGRPGPQGAPKEEK